MTYPDVYEITLGCAEVILFIIPYSKIILNTLEMIIAMHVIE